MSSSKESFFGEQCVCFSDEVKNIGVWLDKQLSFDKRKVTSIVSHSYKLLKDIRRIRNFISEDHSKQLVKLIALSPNGIKVDFYTWKQKFMHV